MWASTYVRVNKRCSHNLIYWDSKGTKKGSLNLLMIPKMFLLWSRCNGTVKKKAKKSHKLILKEKIDQGDLKIFFLILVSIFQLGWTNTIAVLAPMCHRGRHNRGLSLINLFQNLLLSKLKNDHEALLWIFWARDYKGLHD